MKEIWRDINGYENMYQVSNLGNVRALEMFSFRKRFGKIYKYKLNAKNIKICNHDKGYSVVSLKCKNFYVHRLVAMAFLENKKNYKEVNHIDFNKKNNVVSNLEWCTHSMNMKHSYDNGSLLDAQKTRAKRMSGEKCNLTKHSRSTVIKIRNLYDCGYRPIDISRLLGISVHSIKGIVHRKAWKHI